MRLPRVTISGARGIVGEDLTVESALCLARAFARLIGGGPVIVGRDARSSGPMIQAAVEAGLMDQGCDVIRIGLAPTPTVGIMVRERDAKGAVNITASHNPSEWNALKFYNEQGTFLNNQQIEKLIELANTPSRQATSETCGRVEKDNTALDTHCRLIMDHIDAMAIIPRAFSVAVDGCRSVGGIFLPKLLRLLGCEVIEQDCQPDGQFARRAEPVASELGHLCERVRARNCAVGFAVDPDADRLSLVDEQGVALGEEYTLALAVAYITKRNGGGNAVVNLSTSMMVDAAAQANGGRVLRTPIGEANVVDVMLSEGVEIGGEGNGGVIYPRVHPGRDALTGAALILEAMAVSDRPLSELAGELPKTVILKGQVRLEKMPSSDWVVQAAGQVREGEVDTTDGVKVILEDGWYHARLSNTEPICRITAEATSEQVAQEYIERARALANSLGG